MTVRLRWITTPALLAALLAPGALYAAAGDLDCSFGTGGIASFDLGTAEDAYDAALQSDGAIVTAASEGGSLRLTRVLPNGLLDADFGSAGSVLHAFSGLGFAGEVAIDSADRIVVAGRITVAGDSEAFVARFTGEGAIDSSFGGGDGWISFDLSAATASAGTDSVTGVAIDAADRPVIAGHADANGLTFNPSNANIAVARLTVAGALDGSFGSGGIAIASSPGSVDDDARAVVIDSVGRIVVIGSTGAGGADRDTIVVRFTTAGMLDSSFDGDGVRLLDLGGDDFGIDIAVDASDLAIVLGSAQVAGAGSDPALARLTEAGALDTSFAGGGIVRRSFTGSQDVTEHVLVQADGKLLVTGWPQGASSWDFASMRFTTDGVLDTAWGGDGVVTTDIDFSDRAYAALLQPDQKLLLIGDAAATLLVRYLNDDHDVAPASTTLLTSATPDPSDVGAPVRVTWSVSLADGSTATGTVTVSDGVDSCSAVATAGGCSVVLTTPGNRKLTASYETSACHAGSTSAIEAHEVVGAGVAYTVTPQAGSGGSIAPPTPQSVQDGATTAFTVTPDAGYRLVSVEGCGGTLAGNVFTTGAIVADCSVSASFNRNPTATPATVEAVEDAEVTGTLAAFDDDPLQFALVDLPGKGSVQFTDTSTGAIRYVPDADANGSDSFSFQVTDGGVVSAPATVTVTIAPVNDAPSAGFATLPLHPAASIGVRSVPAFASLDAGPADEDGSQSVAEYLIDSIDDPAGVLDPGSVTLSDEGTLGYALTGVGGTAAITARVRDDGGTANGGVDTSAAQAIQVQVAAGADLQVAIDNGREGLLAGSSTVYSIVVANAGPNAVTGAMLADLMPDTLRDAAWSCVPEASNTACPSPDTGSGDLHASVDLPVDGYLRFDLIATVDGTVGAFVTNTASVAAPAGTTALDTANDSATDSDPIVPLGLFADGFEGEAAASLSVPGAAAALSGD